MIELWQSVSHLIEMQNLIDDCSMQDCLFHFLTNFLATEVNRLEEMNAKTVAVGSQLIEPKLCCFGFLALQKYFTSP